MDLTNLYLYPLYAISFCPVAFHIHQTYTSFNPIGSEITLTKFFLTEKDFITITISDSVYDENYLIPMHVQCKLY